MTSLLDQIRDDAGSIQSIRMDSQSVISIGETNHRFDAIHDAIDQIQSQCDRIDELYGIKRTGMPSEQKIAMREVDDIVQSTNPLIHSTKKRFDAVARELDAERKRKGTAVRIDQNHFHSATKKYQSVILRFQQTLDRFRAAVNLDFTRHARIVNPDIEEEQIQKMLKSNDPAKYLQTQIMAISISPQLLSELDELEAEHSKIHKLEQSMREIEELFNAVQVLVVESGERLDEIEQNVDFAVERAEKGHKMVKAAETYAVQTRSTKIKTYVLCFGCCIFVVVVLFLILIPKLR